MNDDELRYSDPDGQTHEQNRADADLERRAEFEIAPLRHVHLQETARRIRLAMAAEGISETDKDAMFRLKCEHMRQNRITNVFQYILWNLTRFEMEPHELKVRETLLSRHAARG